MTGPTVVTWNLHGAGRPDLTEVAARIRAAGAAVAALQEVSWLQARRLARLLGWPTARWSFKHFPLVRLPEGLAVLSPHRAVRSRTVVLAPPARWWSHRRRIAQVVDLAVPGPAGGALTVCNAHLASRDPAAGLAQAGVLTAVLGQAAVLAGDLNAGPGSPVLRRLSAAGWRDAWAQRHGAGDGGATNWSARDTPERPTQRIDYVLVPVGTPVLAAEVPDPGAGLAAYRRLSDHLPLTVRLGGPGSEVGQVEAEVGVEQAAVDVEDRAGDEAGGG